MKKLLTTSLVFSWILFYAQNFDLSTLRIGEFKVYQDKKQAKEVAKKKLILDNGVDSYNMVDYYGEKIALYCSTNYFENQNKTIKEVVYSIKTKSKKFKTKSGMGVGSTREELINTYKNYPNFSLFSYKDDANPKLIHASFSLKDTDAGTSLYFTLENNIVTEIMVTIEEGC